MFILTYLLLAVPAVYGFTSGSGFYIDNGMGQTVRDQSVSLGDQQEIEHEILDLLGLHNRVGTDKHNTLSLKKSASQFLLNIYNKFTEQTESDDSENLNHRRIRQKRSGNHFNRHLFTVADERVIEESDVIMSYLNKNSNMPKIHHRRHGQRLWFDISENSKDCDSLLYASLRIYKNSSIDDWNAIVSGRFITVRASIIEEYNPKQEEHYREPMAEQTVRYNYEGWLEINITEAMTGWMANNISNKGIHVDVIHTDIPTKNMAPLDSGLVMSNKFGRLQPFVVNYCQGRNIVKSSGYERSKRSVKKKKSHSKATKKTMRLKHPFQDRWTVKEKSCQIHTLYVSFRDLNWQEWIIAPNGFAAYFCHGECIFPLNSHLNATNHALIQTLVHLIQPHSVPKPCCAPTKLLPISVLYHIDDTNAILKKYKDMVVKSCGCL